MNNNMIKLIISSEHETHMERADSLSELKRVVLDNYNVKGWKFWLDGREDESATFYKFFRGVKATPKQKPSLNTYLISEVQNQFSEREATKVSAKNLTAAKVKASKMQCFFGTWLKIYAENGNLLASKAPRKGWFNEQ